jgi:small subunit ribosomal protein S3Ae
MIAENVAKQITKECSKIFPLENVLIKKVKVLKKPKFDLTKLMELYQSNAEKQQRTADPTEPSNSLAAGATAGQ